MNKKTIERMATIALAAFLVGYFVYQVAYGMTMNGNPVVFLANDTWTIVNSTSGSVGTIKFHQTWNNTDAETVAYYDTFDRLLNGRHLTGAYSMFKGSDGCWKGSCQLVLCYGDKVQPPFSYVFPGCALLNNTSISQNHLEFIDQHGGTIHLIRQGMTMNNEMGVPSNGTVTFRGNGTSAQFSAPPGSIISNPSITSGYTIGSNGTVTVHGPKGSWATFLGQPGSNTTTNVTPNQGYQSIENSTWYMINSTGSLSKIHFGIEDQNTGLTPYARLLNGNVHHGVTRFPGVTFKLYFGLCNIKGYECDYMKNIESYSDHLVFLDGHHNTIHLVR
jgi:hypothetical protein